MTVLTTLSVVIRRDGFIDADVDGETVALNIETGACYALDRVGRRVWSLLSAPRPIGDICRTLMTEYRVDQATCERQVLELLEELRGEGMIEHHATP